MDEKDGTLEIELRSICLQLAAKICLQGSQVVPLSQEFHAFITDGGRLKMIPPPPREKKNKSAQIIRLVSGNEDDSDDFEDDPPAA